MVLRSKHICGFSDTIIFCLRKGGSPLFPALARFLHSTVRPLPINASNYSSILNNSLVPVIVHLNYQSGTGNSPPQLPIPVGGLLERTYLL